MSKYIMDNRFFHGRKWELQIGKGDKMNFMLDYDLDVSV